MGTTTSARSPAPIRSAFSVAEDIDCTRIERWLYATPFGVPVVPVVKQMLAASRSSTSAHSRSSDWACQQVLVADEVLSAALEQRPVHGAVDHDRVDGVEPRQQLRERGRQRLVDDHDLIVGGGDRVGDLV